MQGGCGVAFSTMISHAGSIQKVQGDDMVGTSPGRVQVVLTYYHLNGNGDKPKS